MKVLIIGVGGGSWEIRGRQLGQAIGARVTASPTASDLAWADVVVLVKRALFTYGPRVQAARKPLIWDALDFWEQPAQNALREIKARYLSRSVQERYRPTLSIGATEEQADELDGVYLPHHSRPGLGAGPIRPTMRAVAYEGTKKYLGSWGKALQRSCDGLGLSFVINPPDLRQADLIVAFRGEAHDGWMCREWKSGVKLVNAIAAGRPVLTQPSAAFREIAPPGGIVESPADLQAAIATFMPCEARMAAAEACQRLGPTYTLSAVAARYQAVIRSAWRQAA